VSGPPHDPWRLPTIRRLGTQLRELERGGRAPAIPRSRGIRRAVLLSGGAIAAALISVIVILATGRSAQARNVVNEAPGVAERSGTLRFDSVLTITVNGHPRAGITERGAIDFTSGAFKTSVRFGNAGQLLERRSSGDVLYTANRGVDHGTGPGRVRWVATPLRRGTVGALAAEADAFTDPPSVFRALSGIRAPVKRGRRESVDGVPATRYHLLTNLDSFLSPSEGHIQSPAVYRRVQASLDVWIDGRGRPLRVDETFTGPNAAGPTRMTTVVRFTAYGRPVSVQAPRGLVLRSPNGTAPPNPLAAGPGSLLARRLFF
jgi:hypothetical protein